MRIEISHKVDQTIERTIFKVQDLHRWVAEAYAAGGFFVGTHRDKNHVFVPWHQIHGIRQLEDEDAAKEG